MTATTAVERGTGVHFAEATFAAMGTTVHVIVTTGADSAAGDDLLAADRMAADLLSAARMRILDDERRLSRFLVDSEVSLVNRSAGSPVRVSTGTLQLVDTAMAACAATDGAFDPLLGAAMNAAGYDRDFADVLAGSASLDGSNAANSQGDVAGSPRPVRPSAFGPSGDERIRIDRVAHTIAVAPGHALDLGGVAKGATADSIAEFLMANGAVGCCVSIGGDLRVQGIGPDGGAWLVALACPGAENGQTGRAVRLSDGAVCTSSTTKRRWMRANAASETGADSARDAHHLIDPSTGASRVDGPRTATIIAATATAAEIITKWVFAGGAAATFEATGVVVDASGQIIELPGFQPFAADGHHLCTGTPLHHQISTS